MSIVVRGLCKQFGSLRAVDDVSFEIPSGGIVGLIGPNGAGKSTILRVLSTFLAPSAGMASIAGFDCAAEAAHVRQSIGYLPESLPGLNDARVDEYLAFRAQLKGVSRRDQRSEIDRVLAACQLTAVRRRLIGRLSQGFRRRVGLADALMGRPSVLILDEPTIGLDPLQVRNTRELLTGLARDCTILLSTHILAEAEALCQRVLVLMRGRLVSDVGMAELQGGAGFEIEMAGPAAECEGLLNSLPQVTSVAHLATNDLWHTFVVAGGDMRVREQAARECLQWGWGLRELRGISGTLEDHFVRLAVRVRREAA
jgi:ABC-2 type transport system ATP-binding protein